MAKIVGFGQAGFVARMQQQSLFGYEPAGAIERQFSPYSVPSGGLGDDPPWYMQCPGGAEPVQAADGSWGCPPAPVPSVVSCPEGSVPTQNADGSWYCAGAGVVAPPPGGGKTAPSGSKSTSSGGGGTSLQPATQKPSYAWMYIGGVAVLGMGLIALASRQRR